MNAYPFIVAWGDGTETRFGSAKEHELAIVCCEARGYHEEMRIRLAWLVVEQACWRCLTVEVEG